MANKLTDKDLDALFAAEREQAPDMSMRLMENILADAAHVASGRQIVPPAPVPVRTGWIQRIMEPFGGVPVLAGGLAAMVIGIYVGYSGTDTLPVVGDYVAGLSGTSLTDFGLGLDSFDMLLEEG